MSLLDKSNKLLTSLLRLEVLKIGFMLFLSKKPIQSQLSYFPNVRKNAEKETIKFYSTIVRVISDYRKTTDKVLEECSTKGIFKVILDYFPSVRKNAEKRDNLVLLNYCQSYFGLPKNY